jgi:hypothetical protein
MEQDTTQTLRRMREEIAQLRVEIARLEAATPTHDIAVEQELRAIEAGALALATQVAGWSAAKIATRSRDTRGWLGSSILGHGKNS